MAGNKLKQPRSHNIIISRHVTLIKDTSPKSQNEFWSLAHSAIALSWSDKPCLNFWFTRLSLDMDFNIHNRPAMVLRSCYKVCRVAAPCNRTQSEICCPCDTCLVTILRTLSNSSAAAYNAKHCSHWLCYLITILNKQRNNVFYIINAKCENERDFNESTSDDDLMSCSASLSSVHNNVFIVYRLEQKSEAFFECSCF